MPFVTDFTGAPGGGGDTGPGGGGGGASGAFGGAGFSTNAYPNNRGDLIRRRRMEPYQNYWQGMGLTRPPMQPAGYQPMRSYAQGAGSPAWPAAYGQSPAPPVGGYGRGGAQRAVQSGPAWAGGYQQPAAPPPQYQPGSGQDLQYDPTGQTQGQLNNFNVNGKANYTNFVNGLINQYIRAGFFNPAGNPYQMAELQRKAISDSFAQQRGDTTAAQLYAGDDPSRYAYMRLMGRLNAGDSLSRGLMDAHMQGMQSNEERFNNLLAGAMGYNFTYKPKQQTQIGLDLPGKLGGVKASF